MPEVTIAWQGGEPTLMGVEFFRRSVELAQRYLQPGQRAVVHDPDERHPARRGVGGVLQGARLPGRDLDRRAAGAARRLPGEQGRQGLVRPGDARPRASCEAAGVEWNALTTVHAANGDHGREVYRFLRDECGARFVQFIPIIERVAEAARRRGAVDVVARPAAVRAEGRAASPTARSAASSTAAS